MVEALLRHNIQLEEMGGDVQSVQISALKVCAVLARCLSVRVSGRVVVHSGGWVKHETLSGCPSQGRNLDALTDAILLAAEIQDLRADLSVLSCLVPASAYVYLLFILWVPRFASSVGLLESRPSPSQTQIHVFMS